MLSFKKISLVGIRPQ